LKVKTGVKERREPSFKCTKCDSSYIHKRNLKQHIKYECGISFQCTLCKLYMATKCSLRNHLLGVHNIDRSKLNKYGAGILKKKILPIYVSQVCSLILKSFMLPGLKDRSSQPYKCDQCGRTYMREDTLASHLKSECGVKPSFDCPRCDKRFMRKGDMKRHLVEIHQVEPSQLAAFGLGSSHFKFFKWSFYMLIYSFEIPTGPVVPPENRFKCDRCGTSFTRNYSLKRHLAVSCGK